MIKTVDKTNVVPAGGDYPFGDIKNDDGTFNGTPLNRELLADYVQFFEKLFSESGLTANDLPDNLTDGFQLYEAFNLITESYSDMVSAAAKDDAIAYFDNVFGMNVYNSYVSLSGSEFFFPTPGYFGWSIDRSGYELDFANDTENATIVTFGTNFTKGVISNIQFLQNPAGVRTFEIIINSTNTGGNPIIRKVGVAAADTVFSIPIGETFQILRRETDWLILP